jgi:hypothetical protein
MDKRKAKAAPPADSVPVVLIATLRWNGVYQPAGTVLHMTEAEAKDYLAMQWVRRVDDARAAG